ncbi:MAG: class I SAM-dependent methyltransferase [Chloroflexota bacterium]
MTYDLLSRFYDLENADFVEDLDFWVGLAKGAAERGAVLELGCGTGRVTQQIARAGINIVGIDNSEAMLALCRAKLARKPELAARATLLLGDMTNFDLTAHRGYKPLLRDDLTTRLLDYSTIGLVIAPFNTFMHLLTTAEQLALLTCARKHLQTGGKLALDLTNPVPAYVDTNESLTLERTFRDDENDLTIQQFSTIRIDRALQIAHIVWQYDAIAVDGTVKRALAPLDLRYTFPAEMGLLLERTGFRLAHLYGDYDETPLTDESERMIVVGEAV